jgi:hypothetical protein
MKTLVTLFLLLIGFTIKAQDFDSLFFSLDSTEYDGKIYVSKYQATFVNENDISDTILIYPFIMEFGVKKYYLNWIFIKAKNNTENFKKVYFKFSNRTLKLNKYKKLDNQISREFVLTSNNNNDMFLFYEKLLQIQLNRKTYKPIYGSENYFSYVFSVLYNFRFDWINEKKDRIVLTRKI